MVGSNCAARVHHAGTVIGEPKLSGFLGPSNSAFCLELLVKRDGNTDANFADFCHVILNSSEFLYVN